MPYQIRHNGTVRQFLLDSIHALRQSIDREEQKEILKEIGLEEFDKPLALKILYDEYKKFRDGKVLLKR